MVGVGVAGVAVTATYLTGNPAYDAIGSIAVRRIHTRRG